MSVVLTFENPILIFLRLYFKSSLTPHVFTRYTTSDIDNDTLKSNRVSWTESADRDGYIPVVEAIELR